MSLEECLQVSLEANERILATALQTLLPPPGTQKKLKPNRTEENRYPERLSGFRSAAGMAT